MNGSDRNSFNFENLKENLQKLNLSENNFDEILKNQKSKLLELKLKSIALEEIENSVVITDKDGQIIWANKSFYDVYKYSDKSILNKNLSTIYPNKKDSNVFNNIKKELFFDNAWEGEVVTKTFDGRLLKVYQSSVPVITEELDEKHFIIVLEDLSSKILYEKHKLDADAREKALLSGIPDLVLKCFINGLIISYHPRENEKLILTKENIVEKNIIDCFPKELAYRIMFFLEKAFQSSEKQLFVYEHENKDGNKLYDEIRIIPTEYDEYLLMIRDITERYEIENQRKKYIEKIEADTERLRKMSSSLIESEKKLKELNANKDKFFSIIAHDLKNPFNTLLSFSDILANQLDELDKEEIKDYSKRIFKASNNVYNLLENLLEWSRLQTNRVEFFPYYFDINDLVNEVIELYKVNSNEKDINIENDNKELFVLADRNMINTVLRNIISNAIKFTKNGGKINITKSIDNNTGVISIEDNGIGMNESLISKLFKIEENISHLGTSNEKGTGLGLILSKEFVEKNNGRISVESKPGVGSKFTIELPIK